MSSTPSKQDLARFFGSSDLRGSKAPTVDTGMNHGFNSLLRDGYIKNNQSLIMKIRQLEVKIRSQNRTIDELRTENTLLRRKLCDREHMADSDVVDALIKERIERKLHKLRIISTRTISYLYKAASNIEQAFEDFSAELAPDHAKTRSHGAAKQTAMNSNQSMVNSEVERTLNDVCESPLHLCAPKQLESCVNTDENDEICLRSETPKGQKHIRNECCRKESNGCHADGKDLGEYVSATQEPSVFSPTRVSETPKNSWFEANKPNQNANPEIFIDDECNTTNQMEVVGNAQHVRRKRAAVLKIKTMTEPRLNNKLRRPGRHDEPHPFISSMY